jgi:hypothetical protein
MVAAGFGEELSLGRTGWQNIPFGINAMQKIAPRRVLEVGTGSGHWGLLLREFLPGASEGLRVEGVAAREHEVSEATRPFYDAVHVGDAVALLRDVPEPWDATIIDGVLTHYPRSSALALVSEALEHSAYVLVNVSLGVSSNGGGPESRSTWESDDFEELSLVRQATFHDLDARYGSFVLSRRDPHDVRGSLFPAGRDYQHLAVTGTNAGAFEPVLRRIAEMSLELGYIKHSATHRLTERLRSSSLYNAARWLATRNRHVVSVRALASRGVPRGDTQVWLLGASPQPNERAIPWAFIERDASWLAHESDDYPFGRCYVSGGGRLRVPVGDDPELRFRTHPLGGAVEIRFRGRREAIDLQTPASGELRVYPARSPMVAPASEGAAAEAGSGPAARRARSQTFSDADVAIIESVRQAGARVLAVHCPRWLGVSSSTVALFEHRYPVPATPEIEPRALSDDAIRHHAAVIAATNVPHLVVSGGDEAHLRLVAMLKAVHPGVRIDVLWHGGYVSFADETEWRLVRAWIEAARGGLVHAIGTVKKGMERFLADVGVRSRFVMNYVPGAPLPPPSIDGEEPRVGLWASSDRKAPHAMLCALAMAGRYRLHAAMLSRSARDLVEFLEIPVGAIHDRLLAPDELMAEIRRTQLSLYVTFAECCPMLPLESMKMGVPCLIGPTSHLFADAPFLFERLVVPFPDRADVIADFMTRALRERVEIMDAYARYIPGYNEAARRSVDEFLA